MRTANPTPPCLSCVAAPPPPCCPSSTHPLAAPRLRQPLQAAEEAPRLPPPAPPPPHTHPTHPPPPTSPSSPQPTAPLSHSLGASQPLTRADPSPSFPHIPPRSPATCANPSKLLKKLRKQRLAATKGIVKGQAKKSNPLAGANQFHKANKSKKKR